MWGLISLALAQDITVDFESHEPETVVGLVTSRTVVSGWDVAAGTTPYPYIAPYPYRFEEVETKDLCTAPCSRSFEAGIYEFYGKGRDQRLPAGHVELVPGLHYTLEAFPGSAWSRGLGRFGMAVGALAFSTGLVAAVIPTAAPRPRAAVAIGGMVGGGLVFVPSVVAFRRNEGHWVLTSTRE